jgi:hypothetical protein
VIAHARANHGELTANGWRPDVVAQPSQGGQLLGSALRSQRGRGGHRPRVPIGAR